jgi:hypothetical protein
MAHEINAEELAEKHGVRGLALRNVLRAHPNLTPDDKHREQYRIGPATEARIIAPSEFRGLSKR